MPDNVFLMRLEKVESSSICGPALAITSDEIGVVALLLISVPQTHFDYPTVANAVIKAITNGHVSGKTATLVLPSNFATQLPGDGRQREATGRAERKL